MHARRRTRLENTIGGAANAFLASGDTNEAFRFVVVRRDFVIRDGPIGAHAVARVRSEVVIGEAQGNAAVMIGAAADDPRAIPQELVAGRNRVGLAFDLPVPEAGVE